MYSLFRITGHGAAAPAYAGADALFCLMASSGRLSRRAKARLRKF